MSVLIISNIAWNFVWQRHQTVASLFSVNETVKFVEIPGIRKIGLGDFRRVLNRARYLMKSSSVGHDDLPNGIEILRPFVLPSTNSVFRKINQILVKRFVAKKWPSLKDVHLVINYSPTCTALDLVAALPPSKLVYDCTDDWNGVKNAPSDIAAVEARIMAKADLTLVPSRELLERKKALARKIVQLPHGVMVERFRVAPRSFGNKLPLTALYYGHIHRQHLDCDLITTIAENLPEWRFRLIGPSKSHVFFPSNVEVIGQVEHAALARYIEDTDVLLLPYAINDYTRAVMPAKAYEYLATGRPIVAARLPELVLSFSETMTFADNVSDWVNAIQTAGIRDSEVMKLARIARAEANSWKSRFAQLNQLIANA